MFGRRKQEDEDPFAALKDGGTYQSPPTTIPDIVISGPDTAPRSQPGQSAQRTAAPDAAPPPMLPPAQTFSAPQGATLGPAYGYGGGRRRSGYSGSGIGVIMRLVFILVVMGAIAIPIVLSVNKAVHSVSVPSFSFSTPTTPSGSPSHARRVSYLTPAGLRSGLRALRRAAPGASVILFRIDGKSLTATAVGHSGSAKQVYYGPGISSVTPVPKPSGEQPVPLSAVRPAVVARLVQEMKSRFHVPPGRIDYMVISSPQGLPVQWIIFSKAPSHPGFAASLSGGGLHRL
jgi:hypothetical protein